MAKSTKGTKGTKGSSTTGPTVRAAQPAPTQGAVKKAADRPAKTKKPAADRTVAEKKTAAKKVAPKKKAAAKQKTAAKRVAAPKKTARPITAEERHRMIAEVAYLRSEAQGFTSDQHSDWLAAEAEVDARLLQQKIDVTA